MITPTEQTPPTPPDGEDFRSPPTSWRSIDRQLLIGGGVFIFFVLAITLVLSVAGDGSDQPVTAPTSTATAQPVEAPKPTAKQVAIEEASLAASRFLDFMVAAYKDPDSGWRAPGWQIEGTLIGADQVTAGKLTSMVEGFIRGRKIEREAGRGPLPHEIIEAKKVRLKAKPPRMLIMVCRDRSNAFGINMDTGTKIPNLKDKIDRVLGEVAVEKRKGGWIATYYFDQFPRKGKNQC